jgi:outer membrane protein, heavy metal efflux system
MRHPSGIPIVLMLVLAGAGVSRGVRADAASGQMAANPGVPPDVIIPSVLSLDEALRLLGERGLDLLMADAAVRTAQGNAQTAAGVANPMVSASDGPTFNYVVPPGCSGCSRQNLSFAVGDNAAVLDELVGKRGLRIEVARAVLASTRLARADALRNLAFGVKQQYVQVALAADTLDLTREIARSLEQTLAVTRQQYPRMIDEGGLARVEIQKLEGDQAVSSAVQALRQAKVGLAFLLGARRIAPDFEIDRHALDFRVPAALEAASPPALLRRAIELRPDVAALGYQRLRADASLQLAQRQQMPDVSLSLNYNSLGLGQGGASPPYFSGQVQTNIPVFYQMQGEIRRARADLTTQSLQHAKKLAQVASDVETAFAAYRANRELVERMNARLLNRATTARDVVEKQFHGGNLTLNDFLDSQRTYIATRLEYLQDLAAYWTAVYQIEQAVSAELRR